jgi:hypothetical protein
MSSPCLAWPFDRHCRRFCFGSLGAHVSTFLRPLAPRALPRFLATTDALTPAGRLFGPPGHELRSVPCRSPSTRSRDLPTLPSPPTGRVGWRFSVVPGFSFSIRGPSFPILLHGGEVSGFAHRSQARPARLGRIEFVILQTGRSPPLPPTPASPQAQSLRLQAGKLGLERTSTSQIAPLSRRTSAGLLARRNLRTRHGVRSCLCVPRAVGGVGVSQHFCEAGASRSGEPMR